MALPLATTASGTRKSLTGLIAVLSRTAGRRPDAINEALCSCALCLPLLTSRWTREYGNTLLSSRTPAIVVHSKPFSPSCPLQSLPFHRFFPPHVLLWNVTRTNPSWPPDIKLTRTLIYGHSSFYLPAMDSLSGISQCSPSSSIILFQSSFCYEYLIKFPTTILFVNFSF